MRGRRAAGETSIPTIDRRVLDEGGKCTRPLSNHLVLGPCLGAFRELPYPIAVLIHKSCNMAKGVSPFWMIGWKGTMISGSTTRFGPRTECAGGLHGHGAAAR